MSRRGDPGCHVDDLADVALVGHERSARVEPDPDLDRSAGKSRRSARPRRRARRQRSGRQRGTRRPGCRPRSRRAPDTLPGRSDGARRGPGVGVGAELVEQPRRALDVADEEGDRAGRQIRSHRPSMAARAASVKVTRRDGGSRPSLGGRGAYRSGHARTAASVPGHRRDRRRDPARQPQQVRVRRAGRGLPAGPGPELGRLLQLRLRVHRGDPGRRRRPHRRAAGHRRADVHRLSTSGARPVGVLEMRDEKGADYKILCVALGDPNQAHIDRVEQMRPHRLVEIEHFFETYKLLEDKTVEVLGWRDRDRAHEILTADRATWERETGGADGGLMVRRGRSVSPGSPAGGSSWRPRSSPTSARRSGRSSAAVRAAADPGEREVRWVRLDGLHVTLGSSDRRSTIGSRTRSSAVAAAAASPVRSRWASPAPARSPTPTGRARSGWASGRASGELDGPDRGARPRSWRAAAGPRTAARSGRT